MGEDQAPAVEVVAVLAELLEREMEIEARALERTFADEEPAPGDGPGQRVEPARVAGVGDRLAAEANLIALGMGLELMRRREGAQRRGARLESLAGMDLAVADREGPVAVVEVVAHRAAEGVYAPLDLRWTDDLDRMPAAVGVERGVEQARNPAEMVAMEMRHQDHVDLVPGDRELREPRVGRRTAVE